MTVWLSLHGAGAVKPAESSFKITPGEIGSVLRPTDANALIGSISFSKEFESPPIVMLSLTGVDTGNEANSRVQVYASEVTSKGFTVHADSWGNTKLYSCGASWIALGP
ncbi:uncharacterized protein EAF02_002658 [Botrytis sinoallii]|uniref:uncharacterized protein n=1 Tax=Botrytis sinoallii TaxID=1463999 RepID=UPI001901FAF6|nr:uncharacterized protein EAF02_002658 [Botrytis sinoallii]KAF7888117.1 hypothetical protein EAF02_002658 [Botrytis sinoallii]